MIPRPSHTLVPLAAALALAAGRAQASSHREAPAISADPEADNTDLYAWVTPGTHDKLYLIAGYNGLHEPGQGNQQTRLCDNVLYEFHIARGVGVLEDAVTYQFRFSSTPPDPPDPDTPLGGDELLIQQGGVKQTYTVTKIVGDKEAPTQYKSAAEFRAANKDLLERFLQLEKQVLAGEATGDWELRGPARASGPIGG